VDHLLGLKENVIIGKLIPAGTGMERYRNVDVRRTQSYSDPIMAELEMAAKASESRRAAEAAKELSEESALQALAGDEAMLSEDTADDILVDDDELLAEDKAVFEEEMTEELPAEEN